MLPMLPKMSVFRDGGRQIVQQIPALTLCFPSTHYENTPIQIYRTFHLQKLKIFR